MPRSSTEILAEVVAIAGRLHAQRDHAARSQGQSVATWRLLEVANQSAGTVPQLARRMGLTRQSVQRVADALAESSLVRFESNPDHKRSPTVRVTELGKTTLEGLQRTLSRYEPDLDQVLEEEDIETTLYVLRAVRDLL